MCQLADDFVLCSCDGEPLTNPDWVLERRDRSRHPNHRRGRAMRPRFSDTDRTLQATVLAGLTRGCFDFDYTPTEGDVLRLKLDGRRLRFRFDDGHWSIDDSTSLTGWRGQMVPMGEGKLGE
ncbi:MAG: hypothetical protein ACI8RZ_000981 [Myxococcota bacterium]|jgi:hypothetical protein